MASVVTPLGVDAGRLPVAPCGPCGRETLTWLDFDDEGLSLPRCLACGRPVDERQLRPAGERSVERMGYTFIDRRPRAPARLSGCGASGVRGCGSGGCSSGGCSTGGCGGGCGR